MNHGRMHPVALAPMIRAMACALVPWDWMFAMFMKNVGRVVLLCVPSRKTSTWTQLVVLSGQFQSMATVGGGGSTPQIGLTPTVLTMDSYTGPLVVEGLALWSSLMREMAPASAPASAAFCACRRDSHMTP